MSKPDPVDMDAAMADVVTALAKRNKWFRDGKRVCATCRIREPRPTKLECDECPAKRNEARKPEPEQAKLFGYEDE